MDNAELRFVRWAMSISEDDFSVKTFISADHKSGRD